MSYFDNILVMLRSKTGHDFSSYKEKTLHRRIERHMAILHIDSIETYVRLLQDNPHELESLFKELLIGVTNFFRDSAEWELLKYKVIPELLTERVTNDTIRVWVSGCSTGEEAYSLAIVFKEVMEQLKPSQDFSLQIFATDLDIDAINKAREGVFSDNIRDDMSLERLNRYFVKTGDGYQVVKTVRDMVIFAQQNMVMDPPIAKIDLLTCRNMLIYLTPEMQKKLIPIFHYSLNPGGFLFLGSAESIVNHAELFKPFDRKSRLYRRLEPLFQAEPVKSPISFAPAQSTASQTPEMVQNIQPLIDKLILQYYSPAVVLVNSKGDIFYINGPAHKYLEPVADNTKWNILAAAREGLKFKLSNAFDKVLRQKEAVTLKNTIMINQNESIIADILINPLKGPKALRGMIMIVFTDAAAAEAVETNNTTGLMHAGSQKEAELERELMLTRQMWQAASSEMQINQEELESSNEELQATNEELQSINEELTTTSEEALLSNEELKHANFDLQARLESLSRAADNMKNQMDSMNIAALFLDNTLSVKHFTKPMSVISRLIPSDVGRPVTDVASDLIYPELEDDVHEVLRTLIIAERQIMSNNGCLFSAHILPYRTLEDKIEGVVITFINITEFKVLRSEMEAAAYKDPQHNLL